MTLRPNLTVHHLLFTLEAQTVIHLGPQAGAQIRGALWEALQQFACTDRSVRGQPDHSAHCPMCRLVAMETIENARGINPPRPFAIQPPLTQRPEQDRLFLTGERFSIGISLFGDNAELFPYVCKAMHRLGSIGVGYGRGQFALIRLQAVNPLTRQAQDLLEGRRILASPGIPVNEQSVARAAQSLPTDQLRLRFLTPTQITQQGGKLSTVPRFDGLIARLLERCQAIELHYTTAPTPQPIWRDLYLGLTEQARQVEIANHDTNWVKAHSGSRRTGVQTAVSGFVGNVVYQGDITPFREWILWGQSLHVGKNAVKGCGWYEVLYD